MNQLPNSLRTGPDAGGHFGAYGGRFVAETLMPLVLSLEKAYEAAKQDPQFQAESAKQRMGIDSLGDREIEALLARGYAAPKPVRDRAAAFAAEMN